LVKLYDNSIIEKVINENKQQETGTDAETAIATITQDIAELLKDVANEQQVKNSIPALVCVS